MCQHMRYVGISVARLELSQPFLFASIVVLLLLFLNAASLSLRYHSGHWLCRVHSF